MPRLAVRQPRQVVAQEIDDDGRKHKKQADPDTPVKMRTFPVRTVLRMNALGNRLFVPATIVLTLTHWFHPFMIPGSDNLPPVRGAILRLLLLLPPSAWSHGRLVSLR